MSCQILIIMICSPVTAIQRWRRSRQDVTVRGYNGNNLQYHRQTFFSSLALQTHILFFAACYVFIHILGGWIRICLMAFEICFLKYLAKHLAKKAFDHIFGPPGD